MFDLFWDLRQEASIRAAHTATARAEGSVERVRTDMAYLQDRVDRLSMLCAAMWTLLQTQADLSDEQLAARVQEIDLSDGRLDGQVRPDVTACRACKRPMAPRHLRCIYCGQPSGGDKPFDAVW
jgi:hypothetical protein